MNVVLERPTWRNENVPDRIIRLALGLIFFQLAFFWLGGIGQVIFYVLGTVMVITAAAGFCPLYKILNFSTYSASPSLAVAVGDQAKAKPLSKVWLVLSGLVLATLLLVGSYASDFFTRKFFLDDYNHMNNYYKQTLFNTGQNDRQKAVENYDRLVVEYAAFQAKYSTYQPYAIQGDAQFKADLERLAVMIAGVADGVHQGDLAQAHLALEQVRPVFQDIFKRNNFSMLAVALVDFHDAMELILDAANAKEPDKVIALYPDISAKLNAVEAEANDAEIQTIRQNLDGLLSLAESGTTAELPAQAGTLKSSFVKVYLKRG